MPTVTDEALVFLILVIESNQLLNLKKKKKDFWEALTELPIFQDYPPLPYRNMNTRQLSATF